MAGKKVPYDATFLTPRVVYRRHIIAADSGPNDEGIPDICLDIDSSKLMQNPGAGLADNYETASRAYNAHLELFVYLGTNKAATCEGSYEGIVDGVINPTDSRCHGTIRVWVWGGPQVLDTLRGKWVLVHEQSVLTDTLIPLRMIPAGVYRITVPDISGHCWLDILEQHTE